VEGVIRPLDRVAEADAAYNADSPDPGTSNVPYRVFNIGNNNPVELMAFVEAIEDAVGKKAEKNFMPLQDGDVPATYANTDALNAWTGFKPGTPVRELEAAGGKCDEDVQPADSFDPKYLGKIVD